MTSGRWVPRLAVTAVAAVLLSTACAPGDQQATDSDVDLAHMTAVAEDAYVFGFPLVKSYQTMFGFFVDEDGPLFAAPINELKHFPRVFTHRDTLVVSPNSDTPYSLMGLDLRTEPLVLTVPEIEDGRFYSVHLADINHHNFGFLGTITTGNGAGSHMVTGPGWDGETPEGITTVTSTDAELGFLVIRTQLFSPDDLENVVEIQQQYLAEPLSSFLGEAPPPAAPPIDFPEWDERALTENFIPLLNFMLHFTSETPDEVGIRARMAEIGIGPGEPFDLAALPPAQGEAILTGFAQARAKIDAAARATTRPLFGTRERVNGDWLARAAAVDAAQWGKDQEQAIYPVLRVDTDGAPLDASTARYTLTFPDGGFPPARAFWSLTMYNDRGFLVQNELERYLINSPMLPDLARDADGGLTLYIQHESPGPGTESNWLPAPEGEFYMILRLYWPMPEALDGSWTPPPVVSAG